ncbi:MAG TPA: hypothetical protein VD766_12465 [Solirubrobacterales bacterium]|nr:hypothetical protein [Solirubrobacterales bacterium]
MKRKFTVALAAASAATLAAPAFALAQATEEAPPAGGAALDQVIIATAGAMVLTGMLLYFGLGHRSGKVPWLGRLAAFSERVSGLPGWAALPSAIAAGALLLAFLGFLWDVSIHIDTGRDEGPLANPSHYLILGGLFGIFTAGFVACVLPLEKPSKSAVRIVGNWYAPLGGVVMTTCGMFALIGFPLDDVWHRIFGQDVTLWGPTHLMLIGGAAMTLIGIAILMVEAGRAQTERGRRDYSWIMWIRRVALSGGLLIGLMVFPVEFDFGVPQFRMIFGPMLIMLAAGVALTAARMWLGRGAAIGAVAFFLLVRGVVAVIVGPVLGETTPHFALFIVEGLVVEAVFLALPRARPLTLGLVTGLGIGTIGLASEWAWSNIWMPIPWTADLLPEGAIAGFLAAVGGSLLGVWVGAHLASDTMPRLRSTRNGAIAGAAIVALIVGFAAYKPAAEGVSANVTLADAGPGEVVPTVRMSPPDAADGAEFINVTSWQGGGLVIEELEPTGEPGVFTTAEPVPVGGSWKTMVRYSGGNTLNSMPIYLPEDPAIPVEGVPASTTFERNFQADHEVLQREQKDVAGWLTIVAYLVVAVIALALLVMIAWALHRLAVVVEAARATEQEARASRKEPAPIGAEVTA